MDFYAVNEKAKGFFKKLFGAVGRFFKAIGRFFASLCKGWREKTETSPLLKPLGPTGGVTEFILRFLWMVFIAAGLYLVMNWFDSYARIRRYIFLLSQPSKETFDYCAPAV